MKTAEFGFFLVWELHGHNRNSFWSSLELCCSWSLLVPDWDLDTHLRKMCHIHSGNMFIKSPLQAQKHPRIFLHECKLMYSVVSDSVCFIIIRVLAWGHVNLLFLFSHPLSSTPLANYHLWPQTPSDFHQMYSLQQEEKPSQIFTRSEHIYIFAGAILYMWKRIEIRFLPNSHILWLLWVL